jgi:hypothetical protein
MPGFCARLKIPGAARLQTAEKIAHTTANGTAAMASRTTTLAEWATLLAALTQPARDCAKSALKSEALVKPAFIVTVVMALLLNLFGRHRPTQDELHQPCQRCGRPATD